jgi:hypothetical protein
MNTKSELCTGTFIVAVVLIVNACAPSISTPTPSAIPTTPLPHSMKGYELYSWQENNEWHFTLTTGTNRVKSPEEIISDENTVQADGWVKISVQGLEALKQALSGLPQHEAIFWADASWLERAQVQPGPIMLPPQETIDVVQEYCKQLGLELTVSK